MEDLDVPDEAFDIVLSSLSFHYVQDFASLVNKISRLLKRGGEFVFSVEHPVFTSGGKQDWHYDEDGAIAHFPVDQYYYEGGTGSHLSREKVMKYHRTLTLRLF